MAKRKKAAKKASKKAAQKKQERGGNALWRGTKWVFGAIGKGISASREHAKEAKVERHRKELDQVSSYEPFKILAIDEGSYEDFEKKIFSNKSTIGIILGARGKGKSALGMRLLENIHQQTKRKCYCMGFPKEDLPSWMRVASTFEEVKSDSVILIDEGGVLYSSRKSMTEANQLLSEALLIARHNDLSIIFISQNSANLEVNTLRQADYLLLKPSSLLQKDFERKKIKDVYDKAAEGFERYKGDLGLTYIYATEFRGFVSNTLPSFWNVDLSKAFKGKGSKKKDTKDDS